MARPRSDEKRSQILDATARAVAERGHNAPTASIAKAAGVAEGSLFTYFRNKEELLSELYTTLIEESFSAVTPALKGNASRKDRLFEVWTNILRWGTANPHKWAAMRILRLSPLIGEQRKREIAAQGRHTLLEYFGIPDEPPGYPTRVFAALVDVTTELMRQKPKLAEQYSAAGFETFLKGVANV